MTEPIRLFSDIRQYDPAQRAYLADILRPLVNVRSLEQNRAIYGGVVDRYHLVDRIEQADWAVLPYSWNYYHRSRGLDLAQDFIQQARQAGKPVVTWIMGDYGARVPDPEVWVFGAAGYQSRAGNKRYGVPVFIRDPLLEQGYGGIAPHAKPAKPRIGFCGYARTTRLKTFAFTIITFLRNTASALHFSDAELQTLYPPPVLLRQRILERLQRSPLVETDFIRNAQYQAGARTAVAQREARIRFFDNIRSNDYTVCVRGSGNFSARLYETLAMGRIPILVDTDCLLPYANDPQWKQCCVYLRQEQINQVAEIVAAFHNHLSVEEFIAIQIQARKFWEERLSIDGFFTHFLDHFGAHGGIL